MKNRDWRRLLLIFPLTFCATNLLAQGSCSSVSIQATPQDDISQYSFLLTNTDSLQMPFTYIWDFGDGSTSQVENPFHQFPGSGQFIVCVQITDVNATTCTPCTQVFTPINNSGFVWPGDINNNGEATNFDLLYLGYAYGQVGPTRQNPDIAWMPQPFDTVWTSFFPDGTNLGYADCDGNGIIDQGDLFPIQNNYLEIHEPVSPDSTLLGVAGADPPLFINNPPDSVNQGETIFLQVELGTQLLPTNNIYGIAFSIEFDSAVVQSISMQWANSGFVTQQGQDIVLNIQQNANPGRFELGITRINHMPVSGFGTIGVLSIVMEDNLSGLTDPVLDIRFEDVKMVNELLEEIPVNKQNWMADIITSISPSPPGVDVHIFPVPVQDVLNIELIGAFMMEYSIMDLLGREILASGLGNKTNINLNMSFIPEGIYFLRIDTNKGPVIRKILISRKN